jgi:hypothetical protein
MNKLIDKKREAVRKFGIENADSHNVHEILTQITFPLHVTVHPDTPSEEKWRKFVVSTRMAYRNRTIEKEVRKRSQKRS